MIYDYSGHFLYDWTTINNWTGNPIGVYFCGYVLPNGNLIPLYIGKSAAEAGVRGRLLQHLNESKWADVTHFGFHQCTTEQEALNLEASLINLHKPKYNKQLK